MNMIESKEKEKEVSESLRFLEELVWLLDSSRSQPNIRGLRRLVTMLRNERSHSIPHADLEFANAAQSYISPNSSKHFLIGVLPNLLQTMELFPANKDIAEFAEQVLSVSVPRYEKRSRYELIGLVICEVNSVSEKKLKSLVEKLAVIVGNDRKMAVLLEEKKLGYFSWNETIRRLSK